MRCTFSKSAFLSGMCKKASLLKTTSNDPSAYLRGPGLICLNVANSLRLFFFANL